MLKVNKPAWQTSDGKLFLNFKEASDYEFRLNCELLLTNLGWCRGGEWSADMIVNDMIEHKSAFQILFTPVAAEEL